MQDELIVPPALQSAENDQVLGVKEVQQLAGSDEGGAQEQQASETQDALEGVADGSAKSDIAQSSGLADRSAPATAPSEQASIVEAITPASASSAAPRDAGRSASLVESDAVNTPVPSSHSDNTSSPIIRDEEVAVVVASPYRRRSSRHAKPKGILKPPPPPQAKFSFKRDVLGYVVGETASLPNLNSLAQSYHATPAVQATTSASSGLIHPDVAASAPPGHTHAAHNAHISTQSASTEQPAPRIGGGLWRRLGGAVSAVAGNVPVAQSAVKTLNNITASVRSPVLGETSRPTSPLLSASTSAAAAEPSQQTQDSLKADFVKSVRFTMSSLTVVYPINGPSPPGSEAMTRKRVNKEHVATQARRHKEGGWTTLDLLDLYEECCRTREEPGIAPLRTLLMVSLLVLFLYSRIPSTDMLRNRALPLFPKS